MEKLVIKFYISLIGILFLSTLTNAQVLYSEIDTIEKKLSKVFKFNVTQVVTGEFDFSYEHFIDEKKSIEAGFGLINPAPYLQFIGNKFFYQGFTVNADYKTFGQKGILKDVYLSPLFRYRYLYYDKEFVSHSDIEYGEHEILETSDKQTYTLALLIGVQHRRTYVVDVYMGLGFRFYSENTEEFKNDDLYNLYYWRPNIEKTSAFFPTFHFGVKIGLDFNR